MGGPKLDHLGDIFTRAHQFLCTFPGLDHYGLRPNADYWGPLYSEHMGEIYCWPKTEDAKIFVYLTPKLTALPQALAAVANLPGFKLAHVPGIDAALAATYQRPDMQIKTEAINMASVLP